MGRRLKLKMPSTTSNTMTIEMKTGRLIARPLSPPTELSAILFAYLHACAISNECTRCDNDGFAYLDARLHFDQSRCGIATAKRNCTPGDFVVLNDEDMRVRAGAANRGFRNCRRFCVCAGFDAAGSELSTD